MLQLTHFITLVDSSDTALIYCYTVVPSCCVINVKMVIQCCKSLHTILYTMFLLFQMTTLLLILKTSSLITYLLNIFLLFHTVLHLYTLSHDFKHCSELDEVLTFPSHRSPAPHGSLGDRHHLADGSKCHCNKNNSFIKNVALLSLKTKT